MARKILLADDSPHAQRMGERILREEGFEVTTIMDGETALIRLPELEPDLILADVLLPKKNGYEICRLIKNDARLRHIKVVLTAGALEPLDEEEAQLAGVDALLKKPFEASVVMETIRPLMEAADAANGLPAAPESAPAPGPESVGSISPVLGTGALEEPADAERVRAAVTLALDAALPAIIDEITAKVLVALRR